MIALPFRFKVTNMNTAQIFKFLQEQIHTVVMATTDDAGNPVTCAIDIMDSDDKALYFLTAKGKNFYKRLKNRLYVSLTGIRGQSTMQRIAVSVQGKIQECDHNILLRLLEKNPYMFEIYPTEQSREGLSAFMIYSGNGEWFDLSKKPIERIDFTFGITRQLRDGYFISEKCNGCGNCLFVCPQKCIQLNSGVAFIQQNHCLRCGNCYNICPLKAIRRD